VRGAGGWRAQTSLPTPGRTAAATRARGQGRPFGAAEPGSQHAEADAASSSLLVVAVTLSGRRPPHLPSGGQRFAARVAAGDEH